VLGRAAVGAVVLIPMTLLGLGVADVAAFNSRATSLEQSWRADESAGVSAADLAPARASLRDLRERRIASVIPYSAFSGALLTDPFRTPESQAASAERQAMARAGARARSDLEALRAAGGPNWDGLQGHMAQLAAARRLADYVRLATAWETEGKQLAAIRDQLAQAAGGLGDDGQPRDVVDGATRLDAVIALAGQAKLSTDPATQALARARDYLKLPYPRQVEQHADVAGAIKSAADTVQHRVDTHAQADQMTGQIPSLLDQAAKYGVTADFPARTGQAKSNVQAAESSGDDGRLDSATTALKQVFDELDGVVRGARQKAFQAAMQGGGGCIPGADPQTIVVYLATQHLVAYDNGCPILDTPTTTGRPALRTDRGTFHLVAKYPRYLMHSPWQKPDPLWYPDTWVDDAMLVVPSDGTFIHSAPWEPDSAYGPGSENGPFASHGCMHVRMGPLSQLFGWAKVGATVIITD